jgi:hypothetical protein
MICKWRRELPEVLAVYSQRMKLTRRFGTGTSILAAVLLIVPGAFPCTWAVGYFHQVTRLHGTVVGVKGGDLRHPFRLLRQRVAVGHARLTLYAYPYVQSGDLHDRLVKQVEANDTGSFDFGVLSPGHYTLLIVSPWGEDRFDVEVISRQKPTAAVTIDVSPSYPDCTGGHEFDVSG